MKPNIPHIAEEDKPFTIKDDVLSFRYSNYFEVKHIIIQRYATLMNISNQLLINEHEQRRQSNHKKMIFFKRRDCYLVKLPLDSCC